MTTGPARETTENGTGQTDHAQTAVNANSATTTTDLLLFVHGTFAYAEREEVCRQNCDPKYPEDQDVGRWWQRKSDFVQELETRLPGYQIVPPGQPASNACAPWWWFWSRGSKSANKIRSDAVFHWSGANSETARRTAGRRLLNHLEKILAENPGTDYHLVGHSHGGNVVWEALLLAFDRRHSHRHKILDRLKTWTTVATPFFHFGPHWRSLPWLIGWLIGFAAVWFYQRHWWADFWGQQPPEYQVGRHAWLAFFLVHVGTLLAVLFSLHLLWALHLWRESGAGKSPEAEQTWYDLFSSLLATTTCVALLYWLARTLQPRGVDLYALLWNSHLWNLAVVAATVWTLATWLGILLSGLGILSVLLCAVLEPIRRQRSREAWDALKSKHRALPVGFEGFDEAIVGLRAIVEIPKDNILPRIPAPAGNRFTRRGNIRQPEYEFRRAQPVPWLVDFLLLPYAVVRDWVVRPFYNDVFAPLVDHFVLTRLWKAAHGTDIRGARIIDVTTTPSPRLPQPTQPACAPPSPSLHATKRRVDDAIVRYVNELRSRIGLNAATAVEVLDLLKKALSGSKAEREILFHTDYFDLPARPGSLADEMAGYIKCTQSNSPVPIDVQPNMRRGRSADYNRQYQFFAGTGQLAVCVALALAPIFGVWLFGRYVLYPHSRARVVAWAMDDPKYLQIVQKQDYPRNATSRSAWIDYLVALPADVALQKLRKAQAIGNRDTVQIWEIEYASRLASDDSRRSESVAILRPVLANLLSDNRSSPDVIALAVAATRHLTIKEVPEATQLKSASDKLQLALEATNTPIPERSFEGNGTEFSALTDYVTSRTENSHDAPFRVVEQSWPDVVTPGLQPAVAALCFKAGMFDKCLDAIGLIDSPEDRAILAAFIMRNK